MTAVFYPAVFHTEETGNSVVVDTNCTQSAFKKGQELFGKDAKIRIDDM